MLVNPCENSLNNLKKSISMSHLESATVPLLNQTSENYYNNGRREAPNAIYLNNILTVNNDTNTEKFSRSGFSSSSVDVLNYENKNNTYSASSNTVKHNLNNNINCSYSSNSFNNFGNKDVNNSSNDRFKSIISGSNANLVTSTTNSNRTESNNYKSTNISYDKSLTGNGNNNSDGKNINNINSDTTITTSDNINNNNNNTANKNNTNGYNNNNSTDSNNNNSNNNSNLFPRVDVVGLSSNLLFEDILSADAFDNNLQPVISGSILNNETTNHNFQPSKLLAEVDNTLLIHEMLISNETQNLGQQLAENSSISTQLSGLKSMPSEQWLELPNFQQSHNLHKQLGLLQQFNLQQNLSQPYTEPSAALANLEIKTDF
ncbi:putative uncharacterized protein DDB_G0286901 [Zophobas morio]|jgi:hypothetical protein|uniref:putative uncharacterized protein DDB_G0286901 n=1 Tax=Zophobas morio TaxID=2755281 RepID=UPI0030827F2F